MNWLCQQWIHFKKEMQEAFDTGAIATHGKK
jgi:hypothetical protein